MLNKILFGLAILALIFVVCGCAMQREIILSQPQGPAVFFVKFVESEKPIVVSATDSLTAVFDSLNAVPSVSEIMLKPFREFRPDPCKGIIKNYSSGLVMWVWLNNRPPQSAAFRLEPQQAVTVYAPIGPLKIYAEAVQKTAYGYRKVGACSQEERIAPYAYSVGDFNWRVYLSDWDFPGMR